MAHFHFEIDASATYSITSPTLEVLVNGVVVSSALISQHTGSGFNFLRFELEYSGTNPALLQFRFNDGAEGGRSVQIDSVRINGWAVDTTYITLMNLNNGQTSAVNAVSVDHLFGRTPPVLADLPAATITGTTGDDRITGTIGPDIINAGNGADRVRGLNNNDAIFGGIGADTIFGGAGNDIIVGDDGDDMIYGEAGNDLLHGSDGNDTISGGDGNDMINGGIGLDTLLGAAGDDIIFGEAGNDTISGGAGTDFLYGDDGTDIISGGAGNDTVYGGLDNDSLYGEAGDDLLYGEGGNDLIYGGAGVDTINGNTGLDEIYGGVGNDTINGGDDADRINGEAGNDTIAGEAGNDSIIGAAGADILTGGTGDDRLLGHGLDFATIATILRNNPTVSYNKDTGNFYRYVNTALDYSSAQGAAVASVLNGVAGHLVAIGSAAENTFVNALFTTNDVWLGAADSGGEAVWRWFGGADDGGHFSNGSTAANNYYTNWAAANPNGGTTENYAVMGTTGTWTDVTGGSTHHYVIEWEGLSFTEDNAIDTISGDVGNDTIYGAGGADILNGGDDNDRIYGGAGNDTLNGDAGNDYVVDYEGANILNGGAGNDTLESRHLPALTVPSLEAQIDAILLANPGLEYNPTTGNFYEYVTTAATWTAANTAALAALINGVAGHLVTINNVDENDYIDQLSGAANIYIGGTDDVVEGAWRWSGGPSNGLQFWLGGSGGSAQGGFYTNFAASQPSAGNADEDYLGMTDGGQWTDERAATTRSYVIEWEGTSLLVVPPSAPAQGNNTLNGGTGNDLLYGGNGNDTLNGDDNDDTLYGGAGNDTLHGNNNIDILYGEAGVDTLYGDAGNDILSGGTGNDILDGGADNDIVAGDTGSDAVSGGTGNDTLYASNRTFTHLSTTFTAGVESFVYADGGFGGTDPGNDNASGTRITTDGAATAAGSLEIFLDGATNTTENNISGSWSLTFTATEATVDTSIIFYYKVIHAAGNDAGDYGYVYASLDGTNYGTNGTNYVTRVEGGSGAIDTGWVQVTLDVGGLTAGSHTLVLGGFKNAKNNSNEDTTIRFDDVQISVLGDTDASATNTLSGNDGTDTLYGSDGTDTLNGGIGNDTLYSGSVLPVSVASILAGNPGVVYDATSQSFYRFINTAVVWTAANTAAQAATINGVAGHLAVVTSAAENTYVDSISGANAVWLGGHDATTEGTWAWQGGPDNGQSFWLGTSTGSAQNGYYTNWLAGQPAASSATDDYLRMRDGGLWDDRTSTQTARYVIEWDDSAILTATPSTTYMNGGDGLDTMYGNAGTDIFIFESASAFNNVDVINRFTRTDGDALDLSDLLSGYDPLTELIADFVMISDGTQADSYAATIRNYDSFLYYRLGETAGTTAADAMGVLNGTYVNTPTLNVADFNGTLTNNAVDFNGTSQYVRVVDNAAFDLNAATFIAWFRSDTNSATQQTVMSKDGTLGGQFNIGVTTNDGDIVGMLQNGAAAAITFDINQSVALNTWYMLTISFSATTGVEIYLNNNSIYTNVGFTTALASNYDFIMGASNTAGNTTMAQYFNGRLDDVAVYNTKLTDAAVANIYNAGVNAVDGTFADGVYVSTGGTANYHNAATRIADFTGSTSVTNAMDMLTDNNLLT